MMVSGMFGLLSFAAYFYYYMSLFVSTFNNVLLISVMISDVDHGVILTIFIHFSTVMNCNELFDVFKII